MDLVVESVACSPTWKSPALLLRVCSQDTTSAGRPTVPPRLLKLFLVTHIYTGIKVVGWFGEIYIIGLGYNCLIFSIIITM